MRLDVECATKAYRLQVGAYPLDKIRALLLGGDLNQLLAQVVAEGLAHQLAERWQYL